MGIAEVIASGFTRFKNYLRASFSQLSDYDAEDIVQQTALNLLSRGDGDDIVNATAYIYRALRNSAISTLHRRHREMPCEGLETGEGDSAEAEALDEMLDWQLEEALALLDEKSRFVFVETELLGKSYKELAEETGEPIGTLLSRKSRAVKKLSIILEQFEDDQEEIMEEGYRRRGFWRVTGGIIGGVFIAAVFAVVFGALVMVLWNWLMPAIFGLGTIGYWQGFGLVLMAKLLFGGIGHRGMESRRTKGPDGHWHGKDWRGKYDAKDWRTKHRYWYGYGCRPEHEWHFDDVYEDWWEKEGAAGFEAFMDRKESEKGDKTEEKED